MTGRFGVVWVVMGGCAPTWMPADAPADGPANQRPWVGQFEAPPEVSVRLEGGKILSVTAVGDVTGDGEGDWVAVTESGGAESLSVVAGPLTGDLTLPQDAVVTWTDPTFADLVVEAYRGGFAVGSPTFGDGEDGRVLLFPAPITASTLLSRALVLSGTGDEHAGASLAAGDLNGDGVDDLVVGAPLNGSGWDGQFHWEPGRVYVIPGPFANGTLASRAMATFTGSTTTPFSMQRLGTAVEIVGDDNGDGLPELALGTRGVDAAPWTSYVGVAHSPYAGAKGVPDLLGVTFYHRDFGSALEGMDLDADGDRDLLVWGFDNGSQQLATYSDLTVPLQAYSQYDQQASPLYQHIRPTPAGDLDGDGVEDLLLVPNALGAPRVMVQYGPLPEGPQVLAAVTDLDAVAPLGDRALAVGDVDGDGADDLGVLGVDGTADVWWTWLQPAQAPVPVSALQPGELVISELLADPTGCPDASAEWVELYVPGAWSVDLGGLELRDLAGTVGTLPGSVVVPGGGYVVVGVGTATGWCDASVQPTAFYGSRPALNNSGSEWLEVRAGATVLDRTATFSGATPARSWSARVPDAAQNDVSTGWCTDAPTPGAANTCE